MTVTITTALDRHRYKIQVHVDGALEDTRTAEHWEVVNLRNRLAQDWSERADRVTANEIPEHPWRIS